MTISKGRDNRVAYVEDYIGDLSTTINQSLCLFSKERVYMRQKCITDAKNNAEDDKEVEMDVFNSMYQHSSIGVLDEHLNYLRAANFCFIYNACERLLRFMISEYKMPYNKNRNSGASIFFNQISSIKSYLDIQSFNKPLEFLIEKVDDEYRKVRVNLTHGESKDISNLKELLKKNSDVHISDDEIFFHGDDYINSFLNCVSEIISGLVNQVDLKSKNK